MFYLILAVVSSAFVSIIMRISEKHVKNNITMLAMNYLMCLVLSCTFTGWGQLFARPQGIQMAVFLGIINGFLYMISFVLLQLNVKHNGVVLSATFMKLGILVSIFVSVVIFKEIPGIGQVVGFLIALAAIVLINFEKEETTATFKIGLILVLLTGGGADAMSKVFEELGNIAAEEQFLLYTFVAALVLCSAFAVYKKQRITKTDVFWGLLIGIPNYFSARFLLKALSHVPAVVAYPTYSVAAIVVVSVAGVAVFGEKISRKQKVAIGIILVSLVLLNM